VLLCDTFGADEDARAELCLCWVSGDTIRACWSCGWSEDWTNGIEVVNEIEEGNGAIERRRASRVGVGAFSICASRRVIKPETSILQSPSRINWCESRYQSAETQFDVYLCTIRAVYVYDVGL
jgi:hypothetical protein